MLYYLILAGAFLTAFLVVILFYEYAFASRLQILKRLRVFTVPPEEIAEEDFPSQKSFIKNFLQFLGVLGRMLPRRLSLQITQQKLIQAQILMRVEEFTGLTLVCGVAFFLLFCLLGSNIWVALLGGVAGFRLPHMVVDIKKSKRKEALTNQLPEALGIIASGLRAGFSFPQALAVVSREMDPPISEEFFRVIRENRLGKPMELVLHDLTRRTDSDDINLLVTALLIQRQVGGNLAEILDNISHTIRERVRIKGEIKTLTTEGRISAVIIVLLPFALASFLLVSNREYLFVLFQDPLGWLMVGMALLMQVVGIFVIRKIIDIEV